MSMLATILTGNAFRVKFTENKSDADIMLIDATINENTTLEAEVTDHPVEDGPDITDHVRPKPVVIDLEGIISETPLTLAQDLSRLTSSPAAALTSIARGFGGGIAAQYASKLTNQYGAVASAAAGFAAASLFQSDANPAKAAREALEAMLVSKKLFKLQTKHKLYDNMVITRLTFPRSNETGKALRFSMQCKRINVIRSQTVAAIARSAAGNAQKKSDLGKQPPKEAKAEVHRSLLKQGSVFIGSFFTGGG